MSDYDPSEFLLKPDRKACWTIDGVTMLAQGPWLKNASSVEVMTYREALRQLSEDPKAVGRAGDAIHGELKRFEGRARKTGESFLSHSDLARIALRAACEEAA